VQPGDRPGLGARELVAQQIAEQMVVAEPVATAVETDQERVGTLNLLHMVSVMQRIPGMIVVPSHDQRAYAEMGRLPQRHDQEPAP
jgi:hypothetical protein